MMLRYITACAMLKTWLTSSLLFVMPLVITTLWNGSSTSASWVAQFVSACISYVWLLIDLQSKEAAATCAYQVWLHVIYVMGIHALFLYWEYVVRIENSPFGNLQCM